MMRVSGSHWQNARGDVEVFDDGGNWSLHWHRSHGDVMLVGITGRDRLLAMAAMEHGLHMLLDA